MSWRRVRPPGVEPLEIWDLPFRGGTLDDALRAAPDGPALGRALGAFVRGFREVAFDAVHVAGGRAELPGLRLSCGVPVTIDPAGRFAGAAGGEALLRAAGASSGTVVDVGQTAAKVMGTSRRVVPRSGRSLDAVVADALAGAPSGWLVLALPCALDNRGVPGPCTYPDVDIERLVRGWRGDVLVLNDAELAAAGVSRARRTLVVTLGYGPGAALVSAERA